MLKKLEKLQQRYERERLNFLYADTYEARMAAFYRMIKADYELRRVQTPAEYMGDAGYRNAVWDEEFQNIVLAPGPDGEQRVVPNPIHNVSCQVQSEECVKQTSGRLPVRWQGDVVGCHIVCGPCLEVLRQRRRKRLLGVRPNRREAPESAPLAAPGVDETLQRISALLGE